MIAVDDIATALDTARGMAAAGIPIFLAKPALDNTGQWQPDGGHNSCGYWLPGAWERTVADPTVLDRWRPGMAVAAVMGHKVDGVDVDPRHGGDQSAANLAAAGCWPRSVGRQITPSGGWHDLVNPLRVRSRDGVLPGIDIKAGDSGVGHGFLFLAPTMKLSKATGEVVAYRWEIPPMLDELDADDDTGSVLSARVSELRAVDDNQAVDVPHAAYDAMTVAQRDTVARYLAGVVRSTADELVDVATWPEGHRDDRSRGWQKVIADAAYRFGQFARADWTGWTYQTAWEALAHIVPATMSTQVGLPATWAAQRGRGAPAKYPPGLGDDAADAWLRDLLGADKAAPVPAAAGGEDAERARRVLPRLDWHALWADEEEDEWLHIPLLPARRSVVIYSPPKAGKSLLVLEFAVALSRGEAFLSHQISRRIRVLYVDFENDPRGDIRSRLQAMGYGPDDLDHIDYLSFPTMAGLDTERGSLELLDAVHAYRPEVVILDTVSRAVDGEENSNDTWLGLYRHTGLKLKQAGVALVRLDHTGKDEMKGTRGGSAKSGDVDAIWRLTRITDERLRLECTDSRMPVETKSLQLTRHRLPRLHHTVEVLGALTDHEAKVSHLISLCNSNGLPADANRDVLRAFAAGRGIKAQNSVLAAVVKARKLSGTVSAETPEETLSAGSGTAADNDTPKPPLTSAKELSASPADSHGQFPAPDLSVSLLPMGGTQRTAGRTADDEAHCLDCGEPLPELRAAAFDRCIPCQAGVAS